MSGLFFTLALMDLGGGALFNSSGGKVSFNSNPSGEELVVDGVSLGHTPVTLNLEKKEKHTVVIKKNGMEKTFVLNKKVGTGWIVLDVLGGLVPVVIDAATGSWYSLQPNEINAQLN